MQAHLDITNTEYWQVLIGYQPPWAYLYELVSWMKMLVLLLIAMHRVTVPQLVRPSQAALLIVFSALQDVNAASNHRSAMASTSAAYLGTIRLHVWPVPADRRQQLAV